MARFSDRTSEELRIRCDALRGLLYAECGFELEEITAVEISALLEFGFVRDSGSGNKLSRKTA